MGSLSAPWQKYVRIRAPLHPPQRRCGPLRQTFGHASDARLPRASAPSIIYLVSVNLRTYPGTFLSSSFVQTSASESLGARQSPRGESEPPEPTFGPLGIAERLNWLVLKKR